jgi:dethiobiotin synthetase
MVKSIFITATGTDVGKTFVSALIVKKMKEFGFNCGYFKPVLSGATIDEHGQKVAGDCEYVVKVANLNINPMSCLSYCFEEAVSPHLASKRAGVQITESAISEDFDRLKSEYDYIVVEGAGGITCPLIDTPNKSDMLLMSDLIKHLGQDVLIVADGGLGTINSILTTVEYARSCGVVIRGIILNKFDRNDFMHRDNLYMVEKMTDIPVVATVSKNGNDIEIEKQKLELLFKTV